MHPERGAAATPLPPGNRSPALSPWPGQDSNLRATDYECRSGGPEARGYGVFGQLREVGWGQIWGVWDMDRDSVRLGLSGG